jgi:peptidyl-prolyl cis-trans isomerase-like protein 2
MELAPVDPETNRPKTDIRITDVTVLIDPFEEFMKQRQEEEEGAVTGEKSKKKKQEDGGFTEEDDQMTWTGKRVRGVFDDGNAKNRSDTGGGVGKYLKAALADQQAAAHAHGSRGDTGQGQEDEIIEFVDDEPEPEPEHVRKKLKAAGRSGGFGNFDSW